MLRVIIVGFLIWFPFFLRVTSKPRKIVLPLLTQCKYVSRLFLNVFLHECLICICWLISSTIPWNQFTPHGILHLPLSKGNKLGSPVPSQLFTDLITAFASFWQFFFLASLWMIMSLLIYKMNKFRTFYCILFLFILSTMALTSLLYFLFIVIVST